MASMKDIAQHCKVSIATVSKALNDQQDISEETKEKVRAAAKELGYYTNSFARALKTKRTYNVGVLFVDEMNSGLSHEYFSSVLESLKSEAENRGYDITFISRDVGRDSLSYLQHAKYRGVDGVAIASVNFHDPQVIELVESEVPVVTIDHVFNNRAAVVSDNVNGMEKLTTYICKMGHDRIAFIHGEQSAVTANRLIGFYRACKNMGVESKKELILEGVYHDPAKCEKLTHVLLDKPEPPTCIIFPDDYSGLGGLNAIAEAGLRIPEDISVAGYDGIPLAGVLSPKLTTYRQNVLGLGQTAAAKLIDIIENPETALLDCVTIQGELVPGASIKNLLIQEKPKNS